MRVQPNANTTDYTTPSHFRPGRILGFYFLSKCSIVCDMNNPIAEQFRVALNYLLQQEGRGAQVRLAVAQNIDRGYLNAVIKGRKPAAEEIRLKIADHFGMTYEAMLTLGWAVQEGTVVQGQGVSRLGSLGNTQSSADILGRHLDKTKSETLHQALEVLKSETEYSAILSGVIDGLYGAMKGKRENVEMVRRLEMLEERLGELERAGVLNRIQKKKTSPKCD
ncbi:hypothetical protein [Desulfobulbus oligotrophicus]|uniref:Uncharacterized protein n=1 Tax=Desulfobulbus oligotrophicus TaxID=1909699 RepID=A0A7T5VB67_9BACT|nr:hypothetical protein [Desulfobulbus oligotrophicus]QQG64679.1 hypothetical protein HP555_01775 [Desulfobulbus oligotrophicus]